MSVVPHLSDEWIVEHGQFLRRLAGALLVDRASGDDVVQDAWLAALQSPRPRQPAGWLRTITWRLARRSDREAVRRRERERAVARDERVPGADSIAARAEIVRIVGEVVAGLPEPFRATLLLRYWEGLQPRHIAERMGVPVATVQSRTRRGVARVRAELERRAPSEERWEESLALAAGLPRPCDLAAASTITTTLGIAMKAKSWIAGVCALFVLTVAGAIGVSALRAENGGDPRRSASLIEPIDLGGLATTAEQPATVSDVSAESQRIAAHVPMAPVDTVPTLAVLVLDAAGQPVPGADLLGGPDARALRFVARTSAGGRVRLERTPELVAEVRVLCARADGWTPSPVYDLERLADASSAANVEREQQLVMQLPLRGASLAVRVRDPRGVPLSGARVFAGREDEADFRLPDGTLARTAPGFTRTTDAGGIARFPGMSPGWLRVFVEHDAYAAATTFATLELERENQVDVTLTPGLIVFGHVLDDRGEPVEGASIRREQSPLPATLGAVAISAADGSYRLGPVRAGKVTARGPDGRRVRERVRGEPGAKVRWNPVLPSEPALRGRVVDDRGAPLSGWFVHANFDTWPGWRSGTTTDEEGRFVIYDPPEGPLRIEVRSDAESMLPMLTREAVQAGSDELRLEVPRDPWTRVVGGVVRSDGDSAATLSLFLRHATTPGRQRLTGGPGQALALDSDDTFDLDVPAGEYELVVVGAPYGWFCLARFDAHTKRTNDVGMLELPAPGIVRAHTWWGGPEPTGDVSYLLERRADQVTVLSFRGTFPDELSLAPGTYTLQTEVMPGPQREIEFEVQSGRVTKIELDLTATCVHRVRVHYTSQRLPFSAVSLEVRRLDDDALVFSGWVEELESGGWGALVELGSGRFEFVARDEAGLEARAVKNLYTPRPGNEIALELEDD